VDGLLRLTGFAYKYPLLSPISSFSRLVLVAVCVAELPYAALEGAPTPKLSNMSANFSDTNCLPSLFYPEAADLFDFATMTGFSFEAKVCSR
jgi:hypothetical protein